ncbi:MAG: hypothetical protein ABF719_03010 [Acetobacter sp.]|uniref:hypothetical protein n=1 Tax=Acetobacter sp. TaxID=440 RepID=UPI0039EA18F8
MGWKEDGIWRILTKQCHFTNLRRLSRYPLKIRQHERREYHNTRIEDLIPTTAGRVHRRLKTILEREMA